MTSDMTPAEAEAYFDSILPGHLGFGPSEFEEIATFGESYILVRVDGTGHPIHIEILERHLAKPDVPLPRILPIFHHETGESLPLMGPISITPIKTRNRLRLVLVKFFHYFMSARQGYTVNLTHTAIGWQGEHAVHLLTPLVEIPAKDMHMQYQAEALLAPSALDDEHVRLLDAEDIEDWYLDADLSV